MKSEGNLFETINTNCAFANPPPPFGVLPKLGRRKQGKEQGAGPEGVSRNDPPDSCRAGRTSTSGRLCKTLVALSAKNDVRM